MLPQGRRLVLSVVAPGLVFTLLFVYGVLALTARTVPDVGGVYREAIVGSPATINPLLADPGSVDADLSRLVFSGLTRLGDRGEALPDLAQSWAFSPDGRSITFHLRPGLTWHDGEPLTASDVLFTLHLLQTPEFPANPAIGKFWQSVSIERIDDLTIRLTTPEPSSDLLGYATIGILPEHILGRVPPSEIPTNRFNSRPVGSGPFMLRDTTIGFMTLDRNPSYYLDRPYIARLRLQFVSSYDEALDALLRQEVDGLASVRPEDLAKLDDPTKFAVHAAPRTSMTVLYFNCESPVFKDRSIRQAIGMAIDRERLIAIAAPGGASPTDSPIPAGSWASSQANEQFTPSPERAKALLDAAGWLPGADGIRQRDDRRLEVTLITNDEPSRRRIAEELGRQLSTLGLEVNLVVQPFATFVSQTLIPRRFDAVVYGIDVGAGVDLFTSWHSSQAAVEGLNLSNWANPDADRFLLTAQHAINSSERARALAEFEQVFRDDMPAIPLYQPQHLYVTSPQIKGIEIGLVSTEADRFRHVADWYFETRQQYVTQDWGLPIPYAPPVR